METIPSKPPSPVEKSQVSFLEKESNSNSNNKSDGTLAEKRTRESIDDDGDGENSDENQMNEENTVTKHTKKLKQDIEEATSPSASLLESGRTEAEAEAEAEADEQQEKDESENNEINNNKPTAISALHSSGVYAMRELNSEEAKIARAKRKLEFTKEDGGSSLDEHLNQNGQNTTTTGNSDNENMDRTDTTTLARVTASEDDKKRKESAGVEEGSSSAFTVPKEVDPKNIGFGFHFATDHVQLQCNSDYVVLLRTVVALEAQRLQALKDLDVLFELKNQACENPLGFLKLLKSYHKSKAEEMDKEKNEDKDKDSSNQYSDNWIFPPRQKVIGLPDIDLSSYTHHGFHTRTAKRLVASNFLSTNTNTITRRQTSILDQLSSGSSSSSSINSVTSNNNTHNNNNNNNNSNISSETEGVSNSENNKSTDSSTSTTTPTPTTSSSIMENLILKDTRLPSKVTDQAASTKKSQKPDLSSVSNYTVDPSLKSTVQLLAALSESKSMSHHEVGGGATTISENNTDSMAPSTQTSDNEELSNNNNNNNNNGKNTKDTNQENNSNTNNNGNEIISSTLEEEVSNVAPLRLPWSLEEQALLDRLLVVYPSYNYKTESERFTCIASVLKTRSVKQIASRVQKYSIKLAKIGRKLPGLVAIKPSSVTGISEAEATQIAIEKAIEGGVLIYANETPAYVQQRSTKAKSSSSSSSSLASSASSASSSSTASSYSATKSKQSYMSTSALGTLSALTTDSPAQSTRKKYTKVNTVFSAPKVLMPEEDSNDGVPKLDSGLDTNLDSDVMNSEEYKELMRLKQLKLQLSSQITHHTGIQCDSCGQEPIVGIRWKCLECIYDDNQIDLCDACHQAKWSNDSHSSAHKMEKLLIAEHQSYQDLDYLQSVSDEYSYLDSSFN